MAFRRDHHRDRSRCLARLLDKRQFPGLWPARDSRISCRRSALTFRFCALRSWEQRWRRAALAAFVVGAILLGWSWLTPGVDATWLNRSVILMLETFGLTALYALVLKGANSRWPQWSNSARACVPWLLGAGAVALFFCLGTEVSYQIKFGAVLTTRLSLIAIGLTLLRRSDLCAVLIVGRSRSFESLRARPHKYVYVAEVLLALFSCRQLTMPWLFTVSSNATRPLVVMVIAYFGVTASEALRRRKLLVLAQPWNALGCLCRCCRCLDSGSLPRSRLFLAAVCNWRTLWPAVNSAALVCIWSAGSDRR